MRRCGMLMAVGWQRGPSVAAGTLRHPKSCIYQRSLPCTVQFDSHNPTRTSLYLARSAIARIGTPQEAGEVQSIMKAGYQYIRRDRRALGLASPELNRLNSSISHHSSTTSLSYSTSEFLTTREKILSCSFSTSSTLRSLLSSTTLAAMWRVTHDKGWKANDPPPFNNFGDSIYGYNLL
jgi:hypothetical protein